MKALPDWSPTNNARKIVLGQLKRIASLRPWQKAAWLLQGIFGLDCDYIPGQDDGEQKEVKYDPDNLPEVDMSNPSGEPF